MKRHKIAQLFSFLAFMITPFLPVSAFVVDEGGTDPEKELLTKVSAAAKAAMTNDIGEINKAIEFLKNELKTAAQVATVTEMKSLVTSLEAKLTEMANANAELKKQSDAQGTLITNLQNMDKPEPKVKSITETVTEMLQNEGIKKYISEGCRGVSPKVETKIAVDMTMASAITGHTTQPTQLLGGMPVYAPERRLSMVDVVATGTSETETVTFNEEHSFVDGVSTLTENQALGQTSFMVREKTLSATRIGTHLIVSKRMLKNEKYLASYIATRIPQKIRKAEDAEILNGTGAGSHLVGIAQNASGFAAGAFAGTILGAQEYDCLVVAKSQLVQGEYEPTAFALNPIDATKISLLKDLDRRYLGIVRVNGVLYIDGLPVIETTAVNSGFFFCGDFKMACQFLYFTPLAMAMSDSHASLFLTNEVCINFEEEVIFPIYNPLMFVYGKFSTAIAALTMTT